MKREKSDVSRRKFLGTMGGAVAGLVVGSGSWAVLAASVSPPAPTTPDYDWTAHKYAMLIDLEKCIGCGRCVQACKQENDVPREPLYFRTWVERYIIKAEDEVRVDSPNGGADGFPADVPSDEIFRSFFVPKLCNHCTRPPCVQACPTGATYATKEGVVLVDRSYCIGCRYCIEACPYGARYLHPELRVADKCTFCYHRIRRGLRPACVEVCPMNVRIFGDLKDPDSELVKLLRRRPIQVLKPALNTGPKAFYLNLDREVR
jgi:Fe-S-cluster-containing dehydrogenase component